MNSDGTKKDLIKTENDSSSCIELESVQAILNEYGGKLISNLN